MFARNNVVYRRGQHGVHRRHVARDGVDFPSLPANPKSSDAPISLPPAEPASATAQTPVVSSSPASSSAPATSTSNPTSTSAPTSTLASSSPNSTSARSSASASSSVASATSLAASTSLAGSTPIASHAVVVTSHAVAGQPFTPTSSLTPSASTTSPADSSGGVHTSVVIGAVAGTLVGLAFIGFLLTWCIRRQKDRDVDDFDADAFKRQSAMLVDDPVGPPQSYNRRPPSMIQSHSVSPPLAAQSGYGGQNFYGGYGEYAQEPAYASEMAQFSAPPPQQAYATSPVGYPDYNAARQPARQPSNAGYLTRQQSSVAGYAPPVPPPSSRDPNAHYIDLNRSSVSPYQAAQYADISRQLGTTNPNGRASQALPDGPLPSPFDDPAETHPVSGAAPDQVTATHAMQSQGSVPAPAAVYEVYGGI